MVFIIITSILQYITYHIAAYSWTELFSSVQFKVHQNVNFWTELSSILTIWTWTELRSIFWWTWTRNELLKKVLFITKNLKKQTKIIIFGTKITKDLKKILNWLISEVYLSCRICIWNAKIAWKNFNYRNQYLF